MMGLSTGLKPNTIKEALIRDFNAKGFNSENLEEIMVEEMMKLGLIDELARKNATAW